jgi:membrane-bound lytic murein transglycosylase D
MEKAGGEKGYWALRQYLPVETQNYVPAYIATVYMMNNYRKHGIRSGEADFNTNTDTITTVKTVSLQEIARNGNFSLAELSVLNPAYLKQTVYASASMPKTLIIPASTVPAYNSVARLVGAPERKITQGLLASAESLAATLQKTAKSYITYRVQPGDSLASISEKFKDLTIEDIISANRLADNNVQPGKLLKINQY